MAPRSAFIDLTISVVSATSCWRSREEIDRRCRALPLAADLALPAGERGPVERPTAGSSGRLS